MQTQIENAIAALRKGEIILYPTDTIWGIGCDATNEDAVNRIFKIKGRSDSKSLIILASDMDMVARFVKDIPQMAVTLDQVSDKPMTIIYPEGINLAQNTLAEDGSIAIRIPKSKFCIEMIRKFGKPIVSTSANISGENPPKTYEEISAKLKENINFQVDKSMDTESTGKPSSIVKLGMNFEVKIIRE